jgi:nicotinamidase-related amidase
MRFSNKKALIVVDMTNDFLLQSYNPTLAYGPGLDLVPRIRRLQDNFLQSKLPVIYATDRHLETDYELSKWGPHSMKGTSGSEIVEGLVKDKINVFERDWKPSDLRKIRKTQLLFEVEKGSYSAFTDNGGKPTALASLLKKLGIRPGSKLFITGLHTNCCDKHTSADAFFRGFVPVLVRDCVGSFENTDGKLGMDNESALNYAKYWYNAEVRSSEEVLRELGIVLPPISSA